MDKNGKVLTGYQNKECKAFYLPLDNGGYGFEWVSNLQVICAVHLKPTQGKNWTFTLPAANKKTQNGDRGYEKDAAALDLCVSRSVEYLCLVLVK